MIINVDDFVEFEEEDQIKVIEENNRLVQKAKDTDDGLKK